MLLCIDVGNSQTQLGVFDDDALVAAWRVSTDERRTADEWEVLVTGLLDSRGLGHLSGVCTCCTVPSVAHEVRDLAERLSPQGRVVTIAPGTRTGLPLQVDNPREVGADRIANSVAALAAYGGPCIVADFGTATTFDVVNARGEYVGGAIAPGMGISAEALGDRGAQLRVVELTRPRSVIARNTVEAIQSGLLYGFAGQVDGIVSRMIDELGGDDVVVVATGGLAALVVAECETETHLEPHLTLTGLQLVHARNS